MRGFRVISPPEALSYDATALPRWPIAAVFAFFPLWWALGLGEAAWIPIALVMAAYLGKKGEVRVPRLFVVWLLFLVWMLFSVVEIDGLGRLIGFGYRALTYLSVTIIFVYVYNARKNITIQYVLGVLTIFWVVIVVGGYLGILFPLWGFKTPLSFVIPAGLQSNEVVGEMVYRRVTQHNPESWLDIAPRPSAPFLYTNGWGNAYSMLTPLVACYLGVIRKTKKFVPLLLMLPISLVPAFLTLNRGMFVGLGVAVLYAAIATLLRGNIKALLGIVAIAIVLLGSASAFDVGDKLDDRLSTSSSTEDRANLYEETIDRTLESPLFGYGAPRPSETEGAPSAGTQGQVWRVLFSHGVPGLLLFLAWFTLSFTSTIRVSKSIDIGMSSVLLVVLVESFYYGTMPTGTAISMSVAALLMRPGPATPQPASTSPARQKSQLRPRNRFSTDPTID